MTRWAEDVSPTRVHPEYPRPAIGPLAMAKPQRPVGSGDRRGGAGCTAGKYPKQILVPFPIESALSGVMQKASHALVPPHRSRCPPTGTINAVLLHFGAVDWQATVSVNGKELGTHRGGYDAFSFDVTDA